MMITSAVKQKISTTSVYSFRRFKSTDRQALIFSSYIESKAQVVARKLGIIEDAAAIYAGTVAYNLPSTDSFVHLSFVSTCDSSAKYA